MQKYKIKDLIGHKYAIHTSTEEVCRIVGKLLKDYGHYDISDCYNQCNSKMCLATNCSYCEKEWYEEQGYIILLPEQLEEYNKELTYSLF